VALGDERCARRTRAAEHYARCRNTQRASDAKVACGEMYRTAKARDDRKHRHSIECSLNRCRVVRARRCNRSRVSHHRNRDTAAAIAGMGKIEQALSGWKRGVLQSVGVEWRRPRTSREAIRTEQVAIFRSACVGCVRICANAHRRIGPGVEYDGTRSLLCSA
jgi:hypothetical protein